MEKVRFNTLASRLLLLLSMVVFMASCKKDDEISPKKKKDLLLKTWEIKEVLRNGETLPANDLVGLKYEFKKDGTYRMSKGNQYQDGKWEMNDDADEIIFDKGTDDETEAKVLELSKSTLNLELTGYSEKTGQVKIEFRMKS